jgi:hypothetical protein
MNPAPPVTSQIPAIRISCLAILAWEVRGESPDPPRDDRRRHAVAEVPHAAAIPHASHNFIDPAV